MWIILVSLVVGIIIGLVINIKGLLPVESMKYNSRFQQIGIIILLFSMGASIGADKKMILNLRHMGLTALVFAVLTSLFSILITYLITSKFMGEE